MKKIIPRTTFDTIVNKHILFNSDIPQEKLLEIIKQIKEVTEKSTKNGNVIFEPEVSLNFNMMTYLEIEELEKNPPLINAIMIKLSDSNDLALPSMFNQMLVNKIMQEVDSKSTPYLDSNEELTLNIEIKSSDIIITNHMDIPPEFHDILIKQFRDLNANNKSLGTDLQNIIFTKKILEENNYLDLITNQSNILAFQDSSGIVFGEVNEDLRIPYEVKKEKYKDIPCVTSESSLFIIEKVKMIELIAKDIGKEKAIKCVEDFLINSPWTQFKIQPGTYSIGFKPNLTPLENLNDKVSNDINVLYELKAIKLENDLKINVKMKM